MQISRDHIILGLIALTLVFLVAGAFLVVYVMLYNERKRKHLQEKEAMQQNFEQALTTTKMEVQEQVLDTIARDIHDNIGQLLSITKATLGSIRLENGEKARQKLDNATSLLEKSIKELRQLASILHAGNILAGGLQQAVENELGWLARTEQFDIRTMVSGEAGRKIQSDRELIAFRIVQEVINNIIKHAEATVIRADFDYLPEALRLSIQDNGKGFDPAGERQADRGLGLSNFYNRAAIIGAAFDLVSSPGSGTKATLTIPYHTHHE